MIQFLLFTALFSSNIKSINIDNRINSSNEIVEVFEEEGYFSNNDYSIAECIYEENVSSASENTIVLSGTIDSYYSCDIDYYCFSILSDTTCQFNIVTGSMSTNLGFVLSKVKYNSNYYNYMYDIENTVTINNSRSFTKQLTCGTYYFYVYDSSYLTNTYYNYTIQMSMVRNNYHDYNILDIKNNKVTSDGDYAGGAIWVSDFVPFSEINVWTNNTNIDFYYNQNYRDLVYEYYQSLSSNGDIHLASYYIWSPNLKSVINASLIAIKECMLEYENNQQLTIDRINYYRDATELVFTVISAGVSLIPNITVNIVNTVFSLLAPSLIDWIFDMLLPKNSVNWSTYKAFLANLIEKTSCTIINNYPVYDNEDIVEIPIYYSITNNLSAFPTNYHYTFDYSKTYIHYYENIGTNVTDYQSNSVSNIYPFDRGRTYYILDNGDYASINSFIECSNMVDELRNPQIMSVNTPDSLPYISIGNYHWIKFIAPSTGRYYFSFHYGLYMGRYINGSSIIVDEFSSVASGYGFTNYIQSHSLGYLLNNGITTSVYFYKNLNENEVIYLRIRGNNWCGLFPSITYMISDYEISEVVHVHQMDIYEWINSISHYKSCLCGYSISEPHVVSSNAFSHGERFARCLLCGGLAERGFVNYMMADGTLLYIFIPNNIDDILYYYESKRELFI